MKQAEHGGQVVAVARRLGVRPEEILDFSASINPLGPAPALRAAVLAAFDQVIHYPDSAATALQEALAAHHDLAKGQVVVGNGSTELIYLLPRLLPEPRWRRALIVAPPFAEYARALQGDGWHVDYFPLSPVDGFALHADRLKHRLHAGYDLLVLANPGNPTGRLYTRHEIAPLLAELATAKVHCILDEAFMDFCPTETAIPRVEGNPQLVILRSMTKFHGIPGLRLGYAIAQQALAARMAELREPWSINALAQAAGLAALTTVDHHQATLALINRERTALADGLATIQGLTVYAGAANYLLLQLPPRMRGSELAAQLEEQRILIRTCHSFPGLDDSFVRVAVRTAGENARLLAAFTSLLA